MSSHRDGHETLPPTPMDQLKWVDEQKSREPRKIREYCPLYGNNLITTLPELRPEVKVPLPSCGWEPPFSTQKIPAWEWRPRWLLLKVVSRLDHSPMECWMTYAQIYTTEKGTLLKLNVSYRFHGIFFIPNSPNSIPMASSLSPPGYISPVYPTVDNVLLC